MIPVNSRREHGYGEYYDRASQRSAPSPDYLPAAECRELLFRLVRAKQDRQLLKPNGLDLYKTLVRTPIANWGLFREAENGRYYPDEIGRHFCSYVNLVSYATTELRHARLSSGEKKDWIRWTRSALSEAAKHFCKERSGRGALASFDIIGLTLLSNGFSKQPHDKDCQAAVKCIAQ